MKKIILMCISLCVIVANVYAEEMKCFEFEYLDGVENRGVAAYFDKSNKLIGCDLCDITIENKICSTELSYSENTESVRLYFPNTQTVIKNFTDNVQEPISDNELTDEKVSVYPTELDEVTAFMFVKNAERAVENGEEKTKLDVFFRGEETEIWVDDDITLKSAPTVNAGLTGKSADVLEKGDIIYCSTNLSGVLRSIELIYRPYENDVVTEDEDFGNNFEKLFSQKNNMVTTIHPVPIAVYGGKNNLRQQYAFGVIKDVKNTKYMTLCNKTGKFEDEMTIDLSKNTVVYVYDKTLRNKVYIGTVGDIEKSEFDNLDEDGNVTLWNEDCVHNYAFVRMADGVALDIACYRGY